MLLLFRMNLWNALQLLRTLVLYLTSLSFSSHITATCKTAVFHLRNILKTRNFLTVETTKTIIHAFVTSKLDYCNSLLYDQPKYMIKRLQSVQNCAGRLIYLSSKYNHVTPLLINLHWLPVQEQFKFRILIITFKALHGQAPRCICNLLKSSLLSSQNSPLFKS